MKWMRAKQSRAAESKKEAREEYLESLPAEEKKDQPLKIDSSGD
jgi:hypothetical protein